MLPLTMAESHNIQWYIKRDEIYSLIKRIISIEELPKWLVIYCSFWYRQKSSGFRIRDHGLFPWFISIRDHGFLIGALPFL